MNFPVSENCAKIAFVAKTIIRKIMYFVNREDASICAPRIWCSALILYSRLTICSWGNYRASNNTGKDNISHGQSP